MELTGSQIVIECLKEQGVDTVFGYPGGAILNIYDALYRHQNEITHILTSVSKISARAANWCSRWDRSRPAGISQNKYFIDNRLNKS